MKINVLAATQTTNDELIMPNLNLYVNFKYFKTYI